MDRGHAQWMKMRSEVALVTLGDAAIACVPTVAEVLDALRALPGARLARMSGSGPTCFALFDSDAAMADAAMAVQAAHRDWWIMETRIRTA